MRLGALALSCKLGGAYCPLHSLIYRAASRFSSLVCLGVALRPGPRPGSGPGNVWQADQALLLDARDGHPGRGSSSSSWERGELVQPVHTCTGPVLGEPPKLQS